uniref:Uncharacterized protein n=1 Tax=Arundo donax TaxID=35708 RepID=A0A0A8YAU9_ARUDO
MSFQVTTNFWFYFVIFSVHKT